LYGSRNWLLSELRAAVEKIPLRKEDIPSQDGLNTLIDLLEFIGFTAIMTLFGLNVNLDIFLLVQRSLSAVRNNLSNLQWMTETLYGTAIPFAKKYLECISMMQRSPPEISEHKEKFGLIKQTVVKQIELKSISFSYDKREDESEDVESISSDASEGEDETTSSNEEEISSEVEASSSQGSQDDVDDKTTRHSALYDVTFCFESGKVYSIVGKNGSGKSTLMNILGKLYEPTEGQVLVNGVPLSQVPETTWSRTLVMVPQDTSFIGNVTFREIISFGLRDSEQESVIEEEVKRCGITDFLKLDAYYGDKESSSLLPGVEKERWIDNFSGGQWKSIALARAFVRKSSATVFILDEPSADLDPQKEYELFERLRKEREGRITIFISHRLQTCRASDCILVMDRGRLVQSGSHKDLLKNESGIYAELSRLQNEHWQDT